MSRVADRQLLADLIAQATVDQEQGLARWSKKLTALVDRAMGRMGHSPPCRVNLDGLRELIVEAIEQSTGVGVAEHYPLAFQTLDGKIYRFVTIEMREVHLDASPYVASVVVLHEE